MLGLPKSTEFSRRIPKQKFYENIEISTALRRVFVDKIRSIYWQNKIAVSTLNLSAGEKVTEIEVFEIHLTEKIQPEKILLQIDRVIPYHIVFLLEHEGLYQAWAAYKEASSGANAFKVCSYYHTDWMPLDNIPLRIDGLNLDRVYENFVRQIGGEALTAFGEETLQQSVNRDIRRKDLQKQISAMEIKVKKEKQLNKQVALNTELKKLKKKLEELLHGENEDGVN